MEIEQKLRVLIVEDDGLVIQMIQYMLMDEGYEIAGIAADGKAGLQAVLDLHPDVVVMDLKMPEMDGVEATRRIQALHPTPVVVLTGYDNLEAAAEAAAAGAGAYVTKPPARNELRRAIAFARASFRPHSLVNCS